MTMNKSIGHYLFIFVLGYIGITILVAVIGSFFSASMSAMTFLAPFFAAALAGERFLKKEQRLPSDSERRTLTNGSFFIFVGINIVLIGLAALVGVFSEAGNLSGTVFLILAGILGFVLLIAYFMIRWAYGKMLHKHADRLIKKDTTFD